MKRKTAILMPAHSETQYSYRKATSDLYPTVGNTGNLLFRIGMKEHVASFDVVTESTDSSFLNKTYSRLIIPYANILYDTLSRVPLPDEWIVYFKKQAAWIEGVSIPLVPLGIGHQCDDGVTAQKVLLHESVVELMRLLSAKAEFLGVRDEKTQAILEGLNISNGTVLGCPSFFINKNPYLGKSIKKKLELLDVRCAVRGSVFLADPIYYAGSPTTTEMNQSLLQLALRSRWSAQVQSPESLISLARNRPHEVPVAMQNEIAQLLGFTDFSGFYQAFKQCAISLLTYDSWLEYLSTLEVSLGARVHGCIASLQAEVPSFLYTVDSRTRCLASTLMLPTLTEQSIHTGNVDCAIQSFDAEKFDSNREILRQRFDNVMRH